MGVVRREGDWRLEKLEDGIYAITYDHQLEAKVVTSDYDPGIFDERFDVTAPVHEVNSFQDAVDLLEEFASSESPSSMGIFKGFSNPEGGVELEFPSDEMATGKDDIGSLPPGGIAVVLLIAGGIFVNSFDFALDSLPFLIGVAMLLGGLAIVGWGFVLVQRDGLDAAISFLTTVDSNSKGQESGSQSSDKLSV